MISKNSASPEPALTAPSPANTAEALGRWNLLTQFLQPETFSTDRQAVENKNTAIAEAAAPLYQLHLTC